MGVEIVLAPLGVGVVHMWLRCFGILDITSTKQKTVKPN